MTADGQRRSHRWTCDGCGLNVYNAEGKLIPRPKDWGEDGRCVQCRLKEAAEEGKEQHAALLLRLGRPVNIAAKTAYLPEDKVKKIQRRLVRAGEIEGPRVLAGNAEKRQRIADALRADPERRHVEIAAELHVSKTTVNKIRKELDLPPPPDGRFGPRRPKRDLAPLEQAIRDDPLAATEDLAKRFSFRPEAVRDCRKRLGFPNPPKRMPKGKGARGRYRQQEPEPAGT